MAEGIGFALPINQAVRSRDELLAFLERFEGRILFGSDIVSMDAHLSPQSEGSNDRVTQASSTDEAFDLYASRYWAHRTMWPNASSSTCCAGSTKATPTSPST